MKKAQGLSLTVVIVAILALVVLGILIFIFSNKIGGFSKGTKACAGVCANAASECTESTNPIPMECDNNGDGVVDGNWCCLKIS